jgi:hypothetical protein
LIDIFYIKGNKMNKLKQLYRDYFGLTEQTAKKHPVVPGLDIEDTVNLTKYNKELTKTKDLMSAMTSEEIDEARLDNRITEYQGGVEMVMIDPALAKQTLMDILQWTKKKGFVVVTKKLSGTGKSAYIYFRLGENPGKEAQRIQGYISQLPNIKHFRFKVRNQPEQPVA